MTRSFRFKTTLLAAVSLTAATVALAGAADATPVEPAAIEHAAAAIDHDAERVAVPAAVRKIGLAAAAAAALAGLFRLIGLDRLKAAGSAAVTGLGAAASAGAATAVAASKAVARAVSSPLRFVAIISGLTLVAFAGVGIYDLEWAGGLALGAVLASVFILGVGKLRKSLSPALRPSRR